MLNPMHALETVAFLLTVNQSKHIKINLPVTTKQEYGNILKSVESDLFHTLKA